MEFELPRHTETALGVHLTVIIALYDCTNSWNSLRLCPLASRFYTNELEGVVHVHTPKEAEEPSCSCYRVPPGILRPSEIWVAIPQNGNMYQYVNAENEMKMNDQPELAEFLNKPSNLGTSWGIPVYPMFIPCSFYVHSEFPDGEIPRPPPALLCSEQSSKDSFWPDGYKNIQKQHLCPDSYHRCNMNLIKLYKVMQNNSNIY